VESFYDTLPSATQQAIYDIHTQTGLNTQMIATMMVEYIIYQMFQLAPVEVRAWLDLLPKQCANDRIALPELQERRMELVEICDMNNTLRAQIH
jgi:hypothetical protein